MRTERVTVGPLGLFFTNVNTDMKLPGHSHTAQLVLVYRTADRQGFPAFAATYNDLRGRVKELTAKAFRNATNEEVARQLFDGLAPFSSEGIARWGGSYWLEELRLGVEGVEDHIGHAEGTTWYTVTTDEPVAMLPPGVGAPYRRAAVPEPMG